MTDMDTGLFTYDPAFLSRQRIATLMTFDDIASFDKHSVTLRVYTKNSACVAPFFTRKNDDNITFFDLHIIPRI